LNDPEPVDDPGPVDDAEAMPESFVVRLDTGEAIHYLDWGAIRPEPDAPAHGLSVLPPLVLLHGLSQTAWSWAPAARRLSAHTRVLAPDLRGHGLSDPTRSGYDLESMATDMLTVLSGNGWGEAVGGPPAVVAGHGFGAMIAATMAARSPSSVVGVALVDGGWEEMAEATRSSADEYLAAIAEPPEVLASMDAFLADRRDFHQPSWDADQERAARAQVDQKHLGHVGLVSRPTAIRGSVQAMWSYDPSEVLASMPRPLAVLVAETSADDEAARERRLALDDVLSMRAARALPATQVTRFTGAGHNLMRYRPDELAASLLALLQAAAAEPD
jgi:pimeloyl-ACP methyl ester carboxylesterase